MQLKKKGFTLLEMVIVLMITVIIAVIITGIYMSGGRVFTNADVKSDLQIELQETHQDISNKLMEGIRIKSITLDGGNTVEFNKDAEDSSQKDIMNKWSKITKIIVTVADKKNEEENKSESNEEIKEENYILEVDKNNTKQLIMYSEKESDRRKILTRNLSDFEVQPKGYDGAEFKIELNKKKWKTDEKYDADVYVCFRNKEIKADN